MTPISTPLPIEVPTAPAATGIAAPEQPTGFSELLSTATATLPGTLAAPDTAPVPVPAPTAGAPAASREPLEGADEPSPQTGGGLVLPAPAPRPEAATPTIPSSIPVVAMVAVAGEAAARTPIVAPAGSRLATGNEPEEPTGKKDKKSEAAELSVQQALAAVAVLANQAAAPGPQRPAPAEGKAGGASVPAPVIAEIGARQAKATPLAVQGRPDGLEDLSGHSGRSPSDPAAASLALLSDQHTFAAAAQHRKLEPSAALPANPTERASEADSAADLRQLDTFVRDIAAASGATNRAAFRLTADQLGPIDVRLHSSEAGVTVTIRTNNEQSHSTVSQAQQQLSDDLRANGLKVAATAVMLGGGGGDRQRQERPAFPAEASIEAAVPDADQSRVLDDQRPHGRYA